MIPLFTCFFLVLLGMTHASIRIEENRAIPDRGYIKISSHVLQFGPENIDQIEPFIANCAQVVGSQAIDIEAVGDFCSKDMESLFSAYFQQNGGNDLFYQLPLVDWEMKTIHKIISTMAEKNVFQLALEKKTMEKKGKKIRHVHPLRFIGYTFNDPYLKKCMNEIKKSIFKWHSFVEGFGERMHEEHHRGNLNSYVPGFAAMLRVNENKVYEYINKKDWEGLVKYLL